MLRVFYFRHRELIDKLIFLVLFIISLYLFINHLFKYVAPFCIGYLISLILNPLVDLLHRKFKIKRGWTGVLLIILLLFLISILGAALFSRIFEEAKLFFTHVPSYMSDMKVLFSDLQEKFEAYTDFLPEGITTTILDLFAQLGKSLTGSIGTGVKQGSFNVVTKLPNIIMTIILSIISAFFFVKDKALIYESIKKVSPNWLKEKARVLKKGFLGALGGYIKAQLIIMSATGTIIVIGLSILRFPYSLFIGILIGIVDALPIFGSGAVFWPWALVNLITGDYAKAAGLMTIYVLVFLTRQFLEPKVLSTQIGIHPILILSSIYAGLKIFGGFGFLLGPMLVLTVKTIFEADLSEDYQPPESIPETGEKENGPGDDVPEKDSVVQKPDEGSTDSDKIVKSK